MCAACRQQDSRTRNSVLSCELEERAMDRLRFIGAVRCHSIGRQQPINLRSGSQKERRRRVSLCDGWEKNEKRGINLPERIQKIQKVLSLLLEKKKRGES